MATFRNRIVVHEGKGLNPSKYFFTTFPVAESTTEYHPVRESKLGPLGSKLQSRLEAIPGVYSIGVTKWKISVHKVAAFKWTEVYPKIVDVLNEELQDRFDYKLVEENWLSLILKRILTSARSILR